MIQFWREDLPHEQYVFFYIDVFGYSLHSGCQQPWFRGDEDDAVAREAFQVPQVMFDIPFCCGTTATVELLNTHKAGRKRSTGKLCGPEPENRQVLKDRHVY